MRSWPIYDPVRKRYKKWCVGNFTMPGKHIQLFILGKSWETNFIDHLWLFYIPKYPQTTWQIPTTWLLTVLHDRFKTTINQITINLLGFPTCPHLQNLLRLQDLNALLPWGSWRAPCHRRRFLWRRRRHVGRRFESPEAPLNVAVVAVAGVAVRQSSRIRRGHGGGRLHEGQVEGRPKFVCCLVPNMGSGWSCDVFLMRLRCCWWGFLGLATCCVFFGRLRGWCQNMQMGPANGCPLRHYLACRPGTEPKPNVMYSYFPDQDLTNAILNCVITYPRKEVGSWAGPCKEIGCGLILLYPLGMEK